MWEFFYGVIYRLWKTLVYRIIFIKPNTMETKNIMSSDLLDILFEARNKQYGAYDLRKTYAKRIRVALISTGALVAVFVVATLFASGRKNGKIDFVGPEIVISDIIQKPPEEKLPPPVPKEIPKQEQITYTVPKIVREEVIDEQNEIKPIEQLESTKIGAFTEKGEKGDPDIVAPPVEKEVVGLGKKIREDIDDDLPFTTVQQVAEFPGGLAGWTKYLQKNLNSDLPVQNGAPAGKYTVIVSFIVAKDGSISDVVAENDPGYGTKAEAVRVIQKGPSWKPAVQNGKNVIYRQRQSIVFMVNED